MREWTYKPGDTLPNLVVASDARRCEARYTDDQSWELALGRGEPPSLTLQTTFGLRARSLRIFPRFGLGDTLVHDPAEFASPVVVRLYGPGFLHLRFAPFSDVQVVMDLWVARSDALCGRIHMVNLRRERYKGRLQLAAVLTPAPDGQRMAPQMIENATVLVGETSGLVPVLFMTGGAHASSGPYSALELPVDLGPGEKRMLQWVLSATQDTQESYQNIRDLLGRSWEPELARQEMVSSGLIEVSTGNPLWDEAFALAQNTAYRLMLSPNDFLPYPSFVLTRRPDYGYSLLGNGSDFNHLWNGQSPLQAFYLATFFLPTAPELVRGLVENFLSTQDQNGNIDSRPGLGGQRSHVKAAPMIANLAWRVYQVEQDKAFLEAAMPKLYAFYQSWFAQDNDRDNDGFPEWSNSLQTGLEEHPTFSHWLDGSPGLEISTVETPDLAAFLYAEGAALGNIARLLGHKEIHLAVQKRIHILHKAVDASFDTRSAIYRSRDRDTHYSDKGKVLGKRRGPGEITINQHFKVAARVYISVRTNEESQRRCMATIHGVAVPSAESQEILGAGRFRWRPGAGQATSQLVFLEVDRVMIEGIEPADEVVVTTSDYSFEDITCLLPLWAGIPDARRARQVVDKAVLNQKRFGRLFGLPAASRADAILDPAYLSVHLPWNSLVIEGLVNYGMRAEAATIFIRLMDAVVQSLQREGSFRRYYNAETGAGSGERDSLDGLPPLGIFLKILGVDLIDARQVRISGQNPFPWPVTVKYRGLTVLRLADKTTIIFANGQTVTLTDAATHLVHQG